MAGSQTGKDLADAYAAMDVFAFSSKSETQGMVLAEAMAARTPVVALDGPGVRDVLNESNGRLLPADAPVADFAAALRKLTGNKAALQALGESARRSVRDYSVTACADRLLALYIQLASEFSYREDTDPAPWDRLLRRLEIEWNLLVEKTRRCEPPSSKLKRQKANLRKRIRPPKLPGRWPDGVAVWRVRIQVEARATVLSAQNSRLPFWSGDSGRTAERQQVSKVQDSARFTSRAGDGIRTRDIQLGKRSARYVKIVEFPDVFRIVRAHSAFASHLTALHDDSGNRGKNRRGTAQYGMSICRPRRLSLLPWSTVFSSGTLQRPFVLICRSRPSLRSSSGFQITNRHIAKRDRPVFLRAAVDKAEQRLGGDRNGEQHQVAGERIVANVLAHVARNAVVLVPDDFAIVGKQARVQAGNSGLLAMLLHQPREAELSKVSTTRFASFENFAAVRSVSSLLIASISMPQCAEELAAEHLDLPCANIPFAVDLRADVVLLDPVAVDDLELPKALPGQRIGQVRAERPRRTSVTRHAASFAARSAPR